MTTTAAETFLIPFVDGEPLDDATRAANEVLKALDDVRAELTRLRDERAAINQRIKVLVGHEQGLERMARIASDLLQNPTTEQGGDDDESTDPEGAGPT